MSSSRSHLDPGQNSTHSKVHLRVGPSKGMGCFGPARTHLSETGDCTPCLSIQLTLKTREWPQAFLGSNREHGAAEGNQDQQCTMHPPPPAFSTAILTNCLRGLASISLNGSVVVPPTGTLPTYSFLHLPQVSLPRLINRKYRRGKWPYTQQKPSLD